MPEQSNDYRVVVFGAGGVGKSSLVLRFVRGTFRDTYVPTIEDTYRQVISCNKQVLLRRLLPFSFLFRSQLSVAVMTATVFDFITVLFCTLSSVGVVCRRL